MKSLKENLAFWRAYHEYYPVVFSAVYWKIRHREDTEDICHEVFIRFLKNFDGIENHRKWLMKSLTFEITNFYRKKDGNRGDTVDIDVVRDNPGLYFENGYRDSRIVLREVVENEENFSSGKEMALFELVAVNSFSFEEAGRYLGITRWQAKRMYNKTSRRLLDRLKSMGIKGIEDLL